jgi:DNA polymerase epsilon subunit 1
MRLLTEKGAGVEDEELISYIAESKMLSKEIKDYEAIKGVGITAAKRMGEFLGKEMV